MNEVPVEIWQHIFSLACTDGGSTGRSLSLVSTYFREISAPFKYQSIAITHWSQIIAFSQLFCKLPASQKKTVSLFVHHSFPFWDHNGYPSPMMGTDQTSEDDLQSSEESEDIQEIRDGSALPECNDGDDVQSLFAGDWTSDLECGSDDSPYLSDGDSEFEGSCDSEEEREILEDVKYLEAVRRGLLPPDGNTRDDILRDADIQAVYDNILQALRAVLNEISSTLRLLAVYWTSLKPLQIHEILPPLPCLRELHINRYSILKTEICGEPPTTVLFPQLFFLLISGDNPQRKLSFSDELAIIAPNLISLRFPFFGPFPRRGFYYLGFFSHIGDIDKQLKRKFGEFKCAVEFYDVYEESPEIWQTWWTNGIGAPHYQENRATVSNRLAQHEVKGRR